MKKSENRLLIRNSVNIAANMDKLIIACCTILIIVCTHQIEGNLSLEYWKINNKTSIGKILIGKKILENR